jgi:photosystem II stability/assembly factor-like uncharacterized protein
MSRAAPRLLVVVAIGVALTAPGAAGSNRVTSPKATVQTSIGPTRFLSPAFGYATVYRTVFTGSTESAAFGLFLYEHGRWRDATPPVARGANTIDDVAFSDPEHGWVAEYNCGDVFDYLYRTADGGRTWHFLGRPAFRSCGGGPTYLSFVDSQHGWMEPRQPNAPGGGLLKTCNGGVSWKTIIKRTNNFPTNNFFCLGPMHFVSRSTGWAARCDGRLLVSRDAGAHWNKVEVKVRPNMARDFDMPRFSGKVGAMATVLGAKRASKVAFFTSSDSGGTWSQHALRPVASCPLRTGGGFYQTFWPESVALQRVWWIVSSSHMQTSVQLTQDAGRHWSSVVARGLPVSDCAVTSVSAASTRAAWAIATTSSRYVSQLGVTVTSTGLFATKDGGRSWKRVELKPRARLSS